MENKSEIVEISFIPFYSEVLAIRDNIRSDIDMLYNDNKEVLYFYAKKSIYYDHLIGKEKSLIVEETYKKLIGIFEYIIDDDVDTLNRKVYEDNIFNLFKKAYKKSYSYFKNIDRSSTIDFNDFINYMAAYVMRLSDTDMDGYTMAGIYFSLLFDNCINNEKILNAYALRWKHYGGRYRINFNSFKPDLLKKISDTYVKLPKYLKFPFKDDQINNSIITFLYDYENLASTDIFNEISFTDMDVKEAISTYFLKQSDISMEAHLEYALHIKALCKAYKLVKEQYFKNNKETMYVELNTIKKELDKAKDSANRAELTIQNLKHKESEQIESLILQNKKYESEINKLKNQVHKLEYDKKETDALRDFIFNMETEDDVSKEDNTDDIIDTLRQMRGVIIGGHPNWQNKMKEILQDWRIINTDVTVNEKAISGADIIFFNTGHLSHKTYFKVIEIIKTRDIKIGYVNSTNILIALREMGIYINKKW